MGAKLASRHTSAVLEHEPASPKAAVGYFIHKLSLETDPSDVHADLERGEKVFLVIDTRRPEAFAKGHIPGAISLWHREINKDNTAQIPKDKLLVTYCSGVDCNGSTKGALRLADLGFRVKEMIGGIESWRKEGYPVEQG